MSAATIWITQVRETPEPTITGTPRISYAGQTTITKLCARCGQQMPHLIRYPVCILCAMDDDEQNGAASSGQNNNHG